MNIIRIFFLMIVLAAEEEKKHRRNDCYKESFLFYCHCIANLFKSNRRLPSVYILKENTAAASMVHLNKF